MKLTNFLPFRLFLSFFFCFASLGKSGTSPRTSSKKLEYEVYGEEQHLQ